MYAFSNLELVLAFATYVRESMPSGAIVGLMLIEAKSALIRFEMNDANEDRL
jgi:hypothetical protein